MGSFENEVLAKFFSPKLTFDVKTTFILITDINFCAKLITPEILNAVLLEVEKGVES